MLGRTFKAPMIAGFTFILCIIRPLGPSMKGIHVSQISENDSTVRSSVGHGGDGDKAWSALVPTIYCELGGIFH